MLRRALGAALLGSALLTLAAAPAGAATPATQALTGARLDTFDHRLLVTGWAYDAARPAVSVPVRVYVDGRYVGRASANRSSPALVAAQHVRGAHGFRLSLAWTRAAGTVTVAAVDGSASRAVRRYLPPAGTRIVTVAKRYVGHARYAEGGAGPRAFDCSGYTRYAYAQARVAALPHNAEQQRHLRRMHRVSARSARPGDLVFYLSGGSAYHVAVYAGHGMQYAAATVRDGIRYQPVWSSSVEYRHWR